MNPNRSADTDNPDSPSNSPTPPPAVPTSRLFSALPTPPPATSPSPSSPTTPSPNSPPDDAAGPTSSTSGTPGRPPGADESSATLSTGSGSSVRISKAGLRTAIGAAFRQGCRLIAVFAATTDLQRETGLWWPDDDDVQDVAAPAANLIYRRVPEEARGGDTLDLIQLGLALAGYVGKQLQRRAYLQQVEALTATAGETPAPAEG